MVRVKQWHVRAGGKVYTPGMIIPGLSAAQEKRLVKDGFCEYVEAPGLQEQPAAVGVAGGEDPEGPALPAEPAEPQGEPVKEDPSEDGPVTEHPAVLPKAPGRGRKK